MAIRWDAKHDKFWDHTVTPPATVLRPTYDGAVLKIHGRTERVMSDVWAWLTYASVWDGTAVKDVIIACDDPSSVYGEATVDATAEVLAAVAEWTKAEAVKAVATMAALDAEERLYRAKMVAKGKTLKVVKGRKVPKGTTGVCIWVGDGHWGRRVGLKDAAGTVHWTAATNVEVLDPEKYLDAA